jgi:hypothetical protein
MMGLVLCLGMASAQIPRRAPSSDLIKRVDYTYQGQKYQFVVMSGEIRQVSQDGKVLLMVFGGTVRPFPNVDLKAAAAAQEALKAYQQAQNPSQSTTTADSSGGGAQPAKNSLTVDGIVTMLNGGISEDVILTKLRSSGQTFDLSPDDMVKLKQAKASDGLMKAMMTGSAGAKQEAPSGNAGGSQTAAPTPAPVSATPAPVQQPAPPAKKKWLFAGAWSDSMDKFKGKTVIDKLGLRNVLPQWDPDKSVAEQFPHVAITVLEAPGGWMEPYETDKAVSGRNVMASALQPCFKLKATVWTDGQNSKGYGPFEWCSSKDEVMTYLEPNYLFSLARHRKETGYITGVNRTEGPAPPETLLPRDRATLDLEAKGDAQGRSVDLNLDSHTRTSLMFANVRKDLGETLTTEGDFRVWIVSIEKAQGGHSIF